MNKLSYSIENVELSDGYENFGQYLKGKWDKLDSKQKEKFEKLAEEDRAKVERKNERSHPENRIYDKQKDPKLLSISSSLSIKKKMKPLLMPPKDLVLNGKI